jgi:hypothetical protein
VNLHVSRNRFRSQPSRIFFFCFSFPNGRSLYVSEEDEELDTNKRKKSSSFLFFYGKLGVLRYVVPVVPPFECDRVLHLRRIRPALEGATGSVRGARGLNLFSFFLSKYSFPLFSFFLKRKTKEDKVKAAEERRTRAFINISL